jgi:tRNA pseudouridine38-40 synthase
MRNIKLTLCYDGSDFHGWQMQPSLRTIQQALTDAIERVSGERVNVHGSGRTDAGVHALAQVANFQLAGGLPVANLAAALNAVLPRTIRITSAEAVSMGFQSRRDALSKIYRYRIHRAPVCPPFLRLYVYHFPYRLDESRMIGAAPRFEGEHDFTSFAARPEPRGRANVHREGRDNVRTLYCSRLTRDGDELIYRVKGSGFLHHMVRNLVGYLIEIGRGVRRADEIGAILAARDRRAAGRMAPAQGLYLESVQYPPDTNEGPA